MKQVIESVLKKIPAEQILKLANDYQLKILDDQSLIEVKAPNDFVTKADREIQNLILDYFAASEISTHYNICAEETLEDKYTKQNLTEKDYVLLIDPLDGTGSFCRGEKKWGCMVGLFNRKKNELEYSWNLVSSGEIFSSFKSQKIDFKQTNQQKSFDIYDYGGNSAKLFPQKLEDLSSGKYKKEQIQVTSHPTAVWTGFELFSGRLNGLLWLPFKGEPGVEKKGKGYYPNYDLIFIGALIEQGWQVLLGKEHELIQVLAVAESKDDLELLKNSALSLMSSERKLNFQSGTSILI